MEKERKNNLTKMWEKENVKIRGKRKNRRGWVEEAAEEEEEREGEEEEEEEEGKGTKPGNTAFLLYARGQWQRKKEKIGIVI